MLAVGAGDGALVLAVLTVDDGLGCLCLEDLEVLAVGAGDGALVLAVLTVEAGLGSRRLELPCCPLPVLDVPDVGVGEGRLLGGLTVVLLARNSSSALTFALS